MKELQDKMEAAWENRALLEDHTTVKAIEKVISLMDVV